MRTLAGAIVFQKRVLALAAAAERAAASAGPEAPMRPDAEARQRARRGLRGGERVQRRDNGRGERTDGGRASTGGWQRDADLSAGLRRTGVERGPRPRRPVLVAIAAGLQHAAALPQWRARARAPAHRSRRGALDEERVQLVRAELRPRVRRVLVLSERIHATTVQLHRAGSVQIEPIEPLAVR